MDSSISPQTKSKKRLRIFGGSNKHQNLSSIGSPAPQDPENAGAIYDLEKIFGDRVARNRLISAISKAEVRPNPCNSIRFCVAVDEFDNIKDKIEKKSKGRKIVAMFIQCGSMFQLNNLPKE
jgi:hypothetical protein